MHRFRLREKSYPWVLFIFFLVIYLLYPTNLAYVDGLYYAFHVEHMPLADTFHPHHLLFLTLTQILYSIIHAVFTQLKGLDFYQSFNSFLAAVTLIYIYRILFTLFKSPLAAFLGTFFYGSSFAFWHHATDANIYISFNLVLTILFHHYLFDKNYTKPSHIIMTALLVALATMIHQLGIFTLIPIGTYLLTTGKSKGLNFKTFSLFLKVYLPAVLIPYLLVFFFVVAEGKPSIALFSKWVTAYGSNRTFWPILYHDVYYVVNMVSRSQFEALFHILPQQKIMYRGFETGESQSLVNFYSFVLALILMLVVERVHFVNFRANPEEKILYRRILVWMFPFFIFFCFFAPENYFYRILYLAPLVIFGGGLIHSSTIKDKKNIKPFIFIFVAFTFIYNAADGIIPESEIDNNPYIVDSIHINEAIEENDLVIFAAEERYLAATFRYYFNRECLHAISRIRYEDKEEQELEDAKIETILFLKQKYPRIFLSSIAKEMGVQTYYLSLNNFPHPHPEIMLFDKDQVVQVGHIMTSKGTYYEIDLEIPAEDSGNEKYVFVPAVPEVWTPVR